MAEQEGKTEERRQAEEARTAEEQRKAAEERKRAVEHAQVHGNTAQRRAWIASAIAAGISFLALGSAALGIFNAFRQVEASRESTFKQIEQSGQSEARRMFSDYLKIAIQEPTLASPESAWYEAIKKENGKEYVRYRMFVDNLLFSCEEILGQFQSDKAWIKTCDDYMKPHARYICETEIPQKDTYSELMQERMHKVIEDAGLKPYNCN